MKQSDLPVIDHSSVAEGINETTNYTIYAVFAERRTVAAPGPQAVEAIEARLRGIEGQPPGNVESVAATGAWWVPLRGPGMTPPYDPRGWHAPAGAGAP